MLSVPPTLTTTQNKPVSFFPLVAYHVSLNPLTCWKAQMLDNKSPKVERVLLSDHTPPKSSPLPSVCAQRPATHPAAAVESEAKIPSPWRLWAGPPLAGPSSAAVEDSPSPAHLGLGRPPPLAPAEALLSWNQPLHWSNPVGCHWERLDC